MKPIMLIALFLVILIGNLPAFGQEWSAPVRIVNPNIGTGGDIGAFSQLLMVNGNPAVAYMDVQRGDLVYVRATNPSGTTWGTPITIDAIGNTGTDLSFQIINGNPAISYNSNSANHDRSLKYVRATDALGSAWGKPISIDANVVDFTTSLLTVNGAPAIVYFDQTNMDLKYIRAADASGTNWNTPVVVDAQGGTNCSLQIVNGFPAISYYGNGLRYVRANDNSGTTWNTPISLDPGVGASYTSLKIVNGNPAIAYYDASFFVFDPSIGRDLKYIRATDVSGTTWGTPLVLDNSDIGGQVSFEVISGNPAISYQSNVDDGDLSYIRATDVSGENWATPITLDTEINVGFFTSLQAINGNPAISYFDQYNGDLKYIRAADAVGSTWGLPLSFDAAGTEGEHLSLQVINGNPAVSFYHNGSHFTGMGFGGLMYARATNMAGSDWSAPVVVDSDAGTGLSNTLSIVNGNPAISFIDWFDSDLKFVRATDASGTTWGMPVTLDVSSYVAFTLVVVSGNPAVFYTDNNNRLKVIRATDASGTAWGTPVVIDATGGSYISFQTVDGNPAIAYQNNELLKFVRATDPLGSTWETPLTIDASGAGMGGTGASASMVIVNGNPAVSYVYVGVHPNELRYVRATNSTGTSWSTPVTVYDSTFVANRTTALQVIDGKPAIAFASTGSKYGVAYVTANDASGNTWQTPIKLVTEGSSYISDINMVSTMHGVAIAYFSSAEALPYLISGITGGTLPVTFTTLKAQQKGKDVLVEWNVQNETGILKYAVEKSRDSRAFTMAATQTAIANNSNAAHYNWLDLTPSPGNNFYRIRSTGSNGEIKYSTVVKINMGNKIIRGYQVYPNPSTGNTINLQMLNQPTGNYTIRFINQLGKVVFSRQLTHYEGSSTETLSLSSIQKGNYFIEITPPNGNSQVIKLLYH